MANSATYYITKVDGSNLSPGVVALARANFKNESTWCDMCSIQDDHIFVKAYPWVRPYIAKLAIVDDMLLAVADEETIYQERLVYISKEGKWLFSHEEVDSLDIIEGKTQIIEINHRPAKLPYDPAGLHCEYEDSLGPNYIGYYCMDKVEFPDTWLVSEDSSERDIPLGRAWNNTVMKDLLDTFRRLLGEKT